jgi:predicted DNA-binding protein with PD1-like motif
MEGITDTPRTSNIIAHVIRLEPGQDLFPEMKNYLSKHSINAAFIMTCVGSLKKIHLRTAAGGGETKYLIEEKCYEIVSLVGCISLERCHVHVGLSDHEGNGFGGHLMDSGNIIFTTAEIVIGVLPQLHFEQVHCDKSGWPELVAKKVNNDSNTL